MPAVGINERSGEALPDAKLAVTTWMLLVIVAAVAIHQNQSVIGRKTAQGCGQVKTREVGAKSLGGEGGKDIAEGHAQIRAALTIYQRVGADDGHRLGAIGRGHAGNARTGYDDLFGVVCAAAPGGLPEGARAGWAQTG